MNFDLRQKKQPVLFLSVSLIILLSNYFANAQTQVEYSYATNSSSKVIDLTREVKNQCNSSIIKKIGSTEIELRFGKNFNKEANQIALKLEESLIKTQKLLAPLQTENIRFYLYQTTDNLENYKIIDEIKNKETYLHLWVFKESSEVNFDYGENDQLATHIFEIIPHEITHGAIKNLIVHKELKWFEEGLAEYIGYEVLKSSVSLPSEKVEYSDIFPKLMLNQSNLRIKLWNWKKNNSDLSSIYKLYQASFELVRLVINNSKKYGIENPLNLLFVNLINFTQLNKNPATYSDISSILKDSLKVNVQSLGILSLEDRTKLVLSSLTTLNRENLSTKEKYLSFLILTNLSEISLPSNSITQLLNELYFSKLNKITVVLLATAIQQRIDLPETNNALNIFLNKHPKLKLKSIKEMKRFIKKLSVNQ